MNKDDIHTFSTTYKTEIVNNTSQKSQKNKQKCRGTD